MCGQRLPSTQWQNATRETEKPNQPELSSNPSAGLLFPPTGELEAADRAAYLLTDEGEDEHPRHAGRLYLALTFLIISLVLLAIHWRQYAHSWLTAYVARSAATNPGEPPDTGEAPAAPATTAPPPTPPPSKPAEKSVKPAEASAAPPVATVPVSTNRLPADLPSQSSPAPPPATSQSAPKPAPAAASAPPEKPVAPAGESSPDATTVSQSIADESPAAQGERYLYGNGVPQDCALARKNLAIAAERKNSRALTLMGTMYATGHCAPRDLPTAYGWFAQALRTDPSNRRIEDDLSLIWKQMTPSEKQLALKK